ncbi:TPA: restriction endonuclease subunit S [Clostridium perfringens]
MKKKAREGYKLTELGEIPNKWEIKKFKDISKVSQGLQIAIEERFKEFKENRLPYITIQYINDKFNRDNEYFIENYNESVVCKKDDILMTRTGNTGIIVTNEYGVFHNNFFKVNFDRKKLNKSFLVYYLNTSFIQNLISRYAGTTTIPDLKHGDFYKLPVVIPSMEEQNKIVAILSTLDEQIENTEKLIQKNQELKKGLMQQLLTKGIGHTEFKKTELGYIPKEWEVKKLGEIFKLSSGSFLSQKNIIEGEYPVYGGNGISGYHNDYLFDESKLIIGRVGAKCGCIHISNYKSWITDNALYISEKIIDFDNKFMYYLLKYKDLNKYANQNAQPVISGKKIYSINVAFPPYHEQVSIALILLNMDKKIKEYKIRKHNLEELKSGLMQQLFTGKIRVI